ncbi:hypothetical protein D5S10_09300 [Pseudomonas savastanoi]|nr:hypothetical protein D5S10_09300 [Pseudomonas savastanoi]
MSPWLVVSFTLDKWKVALIVMHEWAHYDPDAQFTDEVTFFSAFAAFMPSNVHSVVRDLTASAMISALI